MKQILKTFAQRTGSWPVLAGLYRAYHRLTIWSFLWLMRRHREVRSIDIIRSFPNEGWSPGFSDIDLLLTIDELAPEQEAAWLSRLLPRMDRFRRAWPLLTTVHIASGEEICLWKARGKIRRLEARSWQRVYSRSANPALPESVREPYPELELLKLRLDQSAEVFRCYHRLSHAALRAKSGHDRFSCRETYKGLLDIVRYGRPDLTPESEIPSRRAAARQIQAGGDSRLAEIAARFEVWESANYASRSFEPFLFPQCSFDAFSRLRALARASNQLIDQLKPGGTGFSVERLSDGFPREALEARSVDPGWKAAAAEKLAALGAPVVGAWPSYYHLYVFLQAGTDEKALAELSEEALRILDLCAPRSARNPPGRDPLGRCNLLMLPIEALKPLLCSCYLNNPFKYYCFRGERVYSAGGGLEQLAQEPPHAVVSAMAAEAICNFPLNLRVDWARNGRPSQVYRAFLRVMRLKLFIEERRLVLPLASTPDAYLEAGSTGQEWLQSMKLELSEKADGGGAAAAEMFHRYYPKVKAALDGVRAGMIAADG